MTAAADLADVARPLRPGRGRAGRRAPRPGPRRPPLTAAARVGSGPHRRPTAGPTRAGVGRDQRADVDDVGLAVAAPRRRAVAPASAAPSRGDGGEGRRARRRLTPGRSRLVRRSAPVRGGVAGRYSSPGCRRPRTPADPGSGWACGHRSGARAARVAQGGRGSARSRRAPGPRARRCAGRGSRRRPLRACIGTVAAAPAAAASASADRASSGDAPSAIALPKRPGRRGERVDHRLVALAGRAELLHARPGPPRARRPSAARSTSAAAPSALPGPAERRPVQRAGGAADLGDQRAAGQGQHRARASPARPAASSAREHGGEAAGQVDAVVGVADRRVQLGQVVAVGLDRPRRPTAIQRAEDLSVHDGSLIAWEPELASPPQGGRVHRRVPQPGERRR